MTRREMKILDDDESQVNKNTSRKKMLLQMSHMRGVD